MTHEDTDGEEVAATIMIGDPSKPVFKGKAYGDPGSPQETPVAGAPEPDSIDGQEGNDFGDADQGEEFTATGENFGK